MAALAKLRRAASGVCTHIERGWQNRFLPPVYLPPNYEMDVLEKRQLLSVAAHITGPSEVTEGDGYVLSLSASSTAATYSVQNWSISYGDGGGSFLFGDAVADLHTYNTASSPTYDITATVTDTEGTTTYSGSTSMSVTVDEATASLYLSPGEAAAVGQPFDIYQELSDGGEHTLSAYSIAWGDSSSDSDSTTPEAITSGYANDFTHTYSAAGTYSVSGTAVTEQGTVTASTSIVAEPVWLESPTDGYVAGSEYDLMPTFDDPGHTLGSYTVDWGDGSSDDTYAASATSFGHTYSAGGQDAYEATVQAIADDGTWTAYAEADPLAAVWPDSGTTVDRGDTVYLDGSFEANGDEPTAWLVDWGDGTTASYCVNLESFDGERIGGPWGATHSYSAGGTYTVAAIGTDSVGTYTAQSTTIEVDEPTPTFSVDGDDEFTKGQAYDLTASFSISSGDTPNNYFVDWGDGSGEATYSGSATDLSHTYATGTSTGYTINATVVTDFGTYTDSTSVDETPPTVSFTGPDSVTAGQTATFSTSFDDPNGNTPTAWAVYWGDGDEDETSYGDPSSLTHVYTESPDGTGDWTVMAMASEVDGDFWADDATIGVTDATPTVSLSSTITATAGSEYDLNTTFTDPEGRTPYNWTVDWGDGTDSFYDPDSPPEHVYMLPGSYHIAATAVVAPTDRDSQTNESYSATLPVTVADAGSLSFEVDAAVQGSHSQAEVDFTDPDGVTPTLYTVYWGDGSDSYDSDYGNVFGHTYTLAGSFTASAVASTVEGEFTAMQAVDVSPADPGLIVNAPFWGDGSAPYPVAVYFSPDTAGNPTSQFPVAGAGASFTVDWGDGSTGSYSDNHFSHVYTYLDPNTYSNAYGITIVASGDDGLYTATAGAAVGVQQPDGGGAITLGDSPSDATEGQAVTVGAGFSDPEQTEESGYGGRWAVWWGDGSSDGDLGGDDTETDYSPTHIYAEPGNYQVTFAVEYNELHPGEGEPGYMAISDPVSIAVAEATPTLSASSTVSTLTVGDQYDLYPTYTDSVGDHVPNVMTIDWGDGSDSVYEAANQPQVPVTHIYATAGTFEPTLSLSAFLDDGHITATAGAVEVVEPTVAISADGDTATENGQQPASFEVTRTGSDFDLPLTVNYSTGGTLDSDAYVVTDQNDMILDGTATIPVGSASAELLVYPLEDHTPRWTETADLTLTASDNYAVQDGSSAAGAYVESDDLYAWLDNGSDNDIFEGGLPADGGTLLPLVLDLPTETRAGAEITLTDNAPTEADVYTVSSPTDTDTPILGDVSGTYVDAYTWTQGSDDTAPHGETTFWVDGISGSASINDISFVIYDSDANCGPDGTDTNPATPQDEGGDTFATTTVSDSSNDDTAIFPEIVMYNDPNNSGDYGDNIADGTHDYLIGQLVDLVGYVAGPPDLVQYAKVSWDVSGNVAHNILEAGDGCNRSVVPLLDHNGAGLVGGQHVAQLGAGAAAQTVTGLDEPEINFFWTSAASGQGEPNSIELTASLPFGGSESVSTEFDVYTPIASTSVTEGAPEIWYAPANAQHAAGWEVGLGPTTRSLLASGGVQAGIVWYAKVATPSPFPLGSGLFRFVQTVQTTRSVTPLVPPLGAGTPIHSYPKWATVSLDTVDPYGGYSSKAHPFNGGLGWTTDGSSFQWNGDSPGYYVDAATDNSVSLNDSFETYLMYLPAGNGSQWVPLASVPWQYNITIVQTKVGVWTPSGVSATPNPQFGRETQEPQWTQRLLGSEIFPNG